MFHHHELLIAIFLPAIQHVLSVLDDTGGDHTLVINCGYYERDGNTFIENVGEDFIDRVMTRCLNNCPSRFEERNRAQYHFFTKNERVYSYFMTPFDIRCRVFNVVGRPTPTQRYYDDFLRPGDLYIECDYCTVIFFNPTTRTLGIACCIDQCRRLHDNKVSALFLIHRCFLIVRDLINMIEETYDQNTSLIEITAPVH